MAFLIGGANSAADTGFSVANSCRFNDGDTAYMHKTFASGGTETAWTISMWVKRGALGSDQRVFSCDDSSDGDPDNYWRFTDDDEIQVNIYNGSAIGNLITTRKFRDCSSWYHVCVIWKSGDSTSTDRLQLWVNGTRETSFSATTFPSEDAATVTSSQVVAIGRRNYGPQQYFDGYLAEVVFLDGVTASPVDTLGEFDEDSPRIFKPIDVSGLTFGTNGFYLDFEDSANLGNDANGGTDFTEVNLAATDQSSDSPTNNFCTMNPLDNFYFGAAFSEGNLKVVSTDSIETFGTGTMGVASGKWYWEVKVTSASGYTNIGIASEVSDSASNYLGEKASTPNYMYDSGTGDSYTGGSGTDHGDTYTDGDIISVALNLDDNEINYYKNGTVQNSGTAVSITAAASTPIGFYFPAAGDRHDDSATLDFNFGNPPYANSSDAADANGYGAFEYAPPSGYFALCTKNLAEYG